MTRKLSTREEARHLAQQPPRQQLEGGIRALVGIADGLARLDLLEQRARRARRPCRWGCRAAPARSTRFDLPAWSETSTRRRLPTLSGATCS